MTLAGEGRALVCLGGGQVLVRPEGGKCPFYNPRPTPMAAITSVVKQILSVHTVVTFTRDAQLLSNCSTTQGKFYEINLQ